MYSHLNKSNGITSNITNLLNNGFTVKKEHIEEALMIINKNFKFPLRLAVMKDFEDGKIILKYSKTAKLPTCLPFFLTRINGQVVSIVSCDLYGSYDEENDSIKIDPKKLYCLMESAYMAKVIYFNADKISTRAPIFSTGSEIFSNVFTRVLNRKYSLNIDKNKLHKVIMLSSKFFMINMMGSKDNDMVFNYAIKNCNQGNIYILKEANAAVPVEAYTNLETFIKELATNKSLGLNFKDLTVRGYVESFINMYDSSALFALECFPYFMYMVDSVISGAYLNNQYVLEDLVGNNGAKLYNEIVKLSAQ
jgi:hypothetical protein